MNDLDQGATTPASETAERPPPPTGTAGSTGAAGPTGRSVAIAASRGAGHVAPGRTAARTGRAAAAGAKPSARSAESRRLRKRPPRATRPAAAVPPARSTAAGRSRSAGAMIDPAATRRGMIVVAVTAVLGIFIFWQGVHDPAQEVETADSSAVAAVSPVTTAGPVTTRPAPPTAPPTTAVAPGELKVMVTNGVDPKRAIAVPVSGKLKAAGYANPRSIDLPQLSDRSFVYAPENLTAEARAVAKALEWPETTVAVLPNPPPVALGEARVLVVVGKDRAPAA